MGDKTVLICRSNAVSPDPRVQKTATTLGRNGYQVQVIAWDRSKSNPLIENKSHYKIERIQIYGTYGGGLANLFHLFHWQFALLIWMFRNHTKFEVIHSCDFDTIIPSMIMKLVFHKIIIYDIFDFYVDHVQFRNQIILNGLRKLDYYFINRVDAVILVDDSRKKQIQATHPCILEIIYNTPYDISKPCMQEKQSQDFFSIAYVGILQDDRGLDVILRLLAKHPNWRFHFAGFGKMSEYFQSRIDSIPNIVWYGQVSYHKALQIYSQANLIYAMYDPQVKNNQYSSPNKLFEAMMLGKPILVSYGTTIDKFVRVNGIGIVAEYNKIIEIEQKILSLISSPSLQKKVSLTSRTLYEKKYSWKMMETKLLNLYRKMC